MLHSSHHLKSVFLMYFSHHLLSIPSTYSIIFHIYSLLIVIFFFTPLPISIPLAVSQIIVHIRPKLRVLVHSGTHSFSLIAL